MNLNEVSSGDNWLVNQEFDPERDQQRLLTMLARWNQIDSTQIKKRLDKAQVPFCEFSSLLFEDFVQMDLLNEAEHLLRTFKHLPNQSVGYDEICNMPASKFYNQLIFHEAHNNLNELHKALLLTSLKMHKHPPKDLVVGEKNYASKFLIEALAELEKATKALRIELNYFCQTKSQRMKNNSSTKKSHLKSCLFYSTVAFVVYTIWKLRKV